MNGGAGLERGYQRLLACYPRRFRDEHGEELLAVLLASAWDGQQRPGLAESADLVANGLGMRLHPDVSRSARQGWSDALAVYSLAGPVLLFFSTAVIGILLPLSLIPHHRLAAVSQFWPGLCLTLAVQAVIVALVLAGLRKTALAALVPAAAFLWFSAWIPGASENVWTGLSVYLLEAVALIASPGPRRGRRLVHWGHWAVLLLAAAATQADSFMPLHDGGSLPALGIVAIIILVLNRLGRALRLSRYFRLLTAATFYPAVFVIVTLGLGGPGFLDGVSPLLVLALVFAGPLLCAAAALSTVIRPRRRRII